MPGRAGAPGRVELPVASEVGTSVRPEGCVQDHALAQIRVRRAVEGGEAAFAEILSVQLFHLGEPLVFRSADLGEGGSPGHRVVIVSLGEDGVCLRASYLASSQYVERDVPELPPIGQMSPEHIAVPVRPVLGYVAVDLGLGPVVIAQPVPECGVAVLVHHLVSGVV